MHLKPEEGTSFGRRILSVKTIGPFGSVVHQLLYSKGKQIKKNKTVKKGFPTKVAKLKFLQLSKSPTPN